MIDKAKLRSHYKNMRDSINDEIREEKNENIYLKFKKFMIDNNLINCFKHFFVYNSFSSEVETSKIIDWLIKNNKNVLVPKCNITCEEMYAVVYEPDFHLTELNSYGIAEPKHCVEYKDKIDIIIAPGIAFDRFGNRIGFGKGYYDKFISRLSYKPMIAALAFDEQIINNDVIPNNNSDQKMDIVITDKEVITVKQRL